MNTVSIAVLVLLAGARPVPLWIPTQSCPAPTTMDSLLAEMKRDTADAFPSGGFAGRRIDIAEDVVLAGGDGQRASSYMAQAVPRYSGFYRVGVIADRAYRLRGWRCDNLTEWLERIPPLSESSVGGIWQRVYKLGASLNPVGDSAKLLDPEASTGLAAERRLSILRIPGAVAPQLEHTGDGGWEGTVTVFWYHSKAHGLKAVTWEFGFNRRGRVVRLVETPLRPSTGETARVLLGR